MAPRGEQRRGLYQRKQRVYLVPERLRLRLLTDLEAPMDLLPDSIPRGKSGDGN
jgi:hypothetical protein